MKVLLDLDLVPLNTNTRIRDGKSFLFLGSLDLYLHSSFLEESNMQVEMSGSEVNVVLSIILMLMKVKAGMDGVLMNGQGVWNNIVGCQKMVGVVRPSISLGKFGELMAVVFDSATVLDLTFMLSPGNILIMV